VILILAIVGGIGVGVWMSRTSPGHQQPKAIGGSDDNLATGTTTKTACLAIGDRSGRSLEFDQACSSDEYCC
jgi:hypothetical protein